MRCRWTFGAKPSLNEPHLRTIALRIIIVALFKMMNRLNVEEDVLLPPPSLLG
jgi:hypothetical protein